MRQNHGNRDDQFVWQGSLGGASQMNPGDGVKPSYPIAEHGGLIKIVTNIDVPAILAGGTADFSVTYPGDYTTPAPDFHILRYAQPADVAKKLAARGNLWIMKAAVFQGTGLTGAVQPTQGGGTVTMAIRTTGTLTNIWDYAGAIPLGQQVIVPTNEKANGVYIGTDVGDPYLAFRISPATNNLVAGRYRVILVVAEI